MRYFPVNLDVHGRRAVVVGGGPVAARKCAALVRAGAAILVIAPDIDGELRDMRDSGTLSCLLRQYIPGDLAGAGLAFATTDDATVNRAVAEEGKSRGIPVNVVDDPEAGTFTLPACILRGELLITVSTGGKCPAFAVDVRRQLATHFGSEYGAVLELLGAVREKLLTEKEGGAYNKGLLHTLIGRNLPQLFANYEFAEIDRILLELFGPGYSLAELGVREKDSE